MRSPADRRSRTWLEVALRTVALAALVAWIANAARPAMSRRETVRGASLPDALPRWTHDRVDSAHVLLDTVPDPGSLAWLRALRGAGMGVAWSGTAVSDIALETYAPTDAAGGIVAIVASRES